MKQLSTLQCQSLRGEDIRGYNFVYTMLKNAPNLTIQ